MLTISTLIFFLSIIQSLFGVGVLLFGTPLMLVMGHDYQEALMYLLPASAAISFSQIIDMRKISLEGNYRKYFFMICLPLLVISMIFAQKLNLKNEIKVFIVVLLVFTLMMRALPSIRVFFQNLMRKQVFVSLGLMGMIHGLSNMGGSILAPLASSLFHEKEKTLAATSFSYAFMATSQLIVLLLIRNQPFLPEYLVGALIALGVRYSIGKKVFHFTSERIYQHLISLFILANAVLLILTLR